MRKIRNTVCILFAFSCVVFAMHLVKARIVEDHTPPVITCAEESVSVSVKAEDSEILAGVTAKDDKDGDITKSVRISSMSHFIEKGKRTVTYAVFDKANQAATAERTLIYTDYYSPRIYLKKPLRYTNNEVRNADFSENMTAEDCLDGDLTKQIHITEEDDVYIRDPGTYALKVQVNNRAGDVRSVPVEVVITDANDPAENSKEYPMLTEYIVYTSVGVPVDPAAYLAGVMRGNVEYKFDENPEYFGVSREQIGIQPNVDYSKPGTYTVDYIYTNEIGVTAVTKLYVVVEG